MPRADDVLERVRRWMEEQRFLLGGEAVLVGVSGGPDSVALFRALQALAPRLRLRLTVAHVHHGIRGEDADRDQRFVESLAAQCGCAIVTRRLAPSPDHNEETLREARYDALLMMAREAQAAVIAVGHTLDDHVETVLMRIIRGTGVEGLQGIPAARTIADCRLIRPLRSIWRADVEEWLRAIHQPWRDDATNAAPTWLRNRIRHELLPFLAERYNPRMKHALRHLADAAAAAWEHVDAQANRWLDAHGTFAGQPAVAVMPRSSLLEQPRAVQQAVVREALRRVQGHLRRFTYQHWLEVEALLAERPVGSIVDLPGRMQMEKTTDALIVRQRHDETTDAITVCQNESFTV